jgi:predicted phosphoribosyltransferase
MPIHNKELRFRDRKDGGRQLAQRLLFYRDTDVVVYALPRGGIVTAIEIANTLNAPIDLIIPRKIGHPSNPEYAIGAVAEDGHLVAEIICLSIPEFLGSKILRSPSSYANTPYLNTFYIRSNNH